MRGGKSVLQGGEIVERTNGMALFYVLDYKREKAQLQRDSGPHDTLEMIKPKIPHDKGVKEGASIGIHNDHLNQMMNEPHKGLSLEESERLETPWDQRNLPRWRHMTGPQIPTKQIESIEGVFDEHIENIKASVNFLPPPFEREQWRNTKVS